MSKLIVEMEMPVCCVDCPCCICLNGMKPAYCKAVMVDDDNIVDGLMWRETDPNNRPSWCPIKGELVRCGECKYFIENTWECVRLSDRFGDEYSDARVYPEYYCADGERKDGEHDNQRM